MVGVVAISFFSVLFRRMRLRWDNDDSVRHLAVDVLYLRLQISHEPLPYRALSLLV